MSNEMESIKGVKVSDVFDLTKVTFPFSYTDKQVRVAGRAIANYDRLVEENAELREMLQHVMKCAAMQDNELIDAEEIKKLLNK